MSQGIAFLPFLAFLMTAAAYRVTFSDHQLTKFLGTLEEYAETVNDVVFLLDESGSIGISRYSQVKLFTKLTVRHLAVSADYSRVAIVSFADYPRVHADYIRDSYGNNMCTLIDVINHLDYIGSGTATSLAMEKAVKLFVQGRENSTKIIVLITDGESNSNHKPFKIAEYLKALGVKIFAVGVADVNTQEVEAVASSLDHVYILTDFSYIETVNENIKKAFTDLIWDVATNNSLCNDFCESKTSCCDTHASCSCGTRNGFYECVCMPGYSGTGHKNDCHECPKGTYKSKMGNIPCTPCPESSTTSKGGSTSEKDCICEVGYQHLDGYCKPIECARIEAPTGGILIPPNCSNIYGSECTFRCREGYCPHSCSLSKTDQDLNIHPWNRVPLQSRYCLETAKWSGEDFHCEKMTCPVLDPPLNGKHNCSGSDFTFGTTCQFACENGYEMIGSDVLQCLVNGTWTGGETLCKAIYCEPLKSNLNLIVKPPQCTKKRMEYNSECQYYCAKEYQLISQYGPIDGRNKCLANRTWSGAHLKISCADKTPPTIKCPSSIVTTTDAFKATAMLMWKDPVAKDNVYVAAVTISEPSFIQKLPYPFPIGTTKVVYEVHDSSNLSSSCSFDVTVEDKEPPKVLYCPEDIEIFHPNQKVAVSWQEPKFTDNSGKINVLRNNRKSGSNFAWGPPAVIFYNASDAADNIASCKFTVKVRQYPCPDIDAPANGIVTCDTWLDRSLCSVYCNDGYDFVLNQTVPTTFSCSQKKAGLNKEGQWVPFPEKIKVKFPLPDCARIQKRSAVKTTMEMNFTVDECNTEIMNKMKKKFIATLMPLERKMKGLICPLQKGCRPENVNVTCTSSRSKRSVPSSNPTKSTLEISFDVELYPKENEDLDETLFNVSGVNSNMDGSHPVIKEIEAEAIKNVREVYKVPSLPPPKVNHVVTSICSVGQMKKNDSCVNCPAGTYKDDFTDTCVDCPTATYQDKENSLSCLPCKKDYTTYHTRSKSESECKAPCQPGTYSRTTFEPCSLCPFHTYQENFYGKECLKCPHGLQTFRVGSNSSSDCSASCPQGSYSDTGLEPCKLCEFGFYQNVSQEKYCEMCPAGTTTERRGATSSNQCKEINLCEDLQPCSNTSTCVPSGNSYQCLCPYGAFGKNCEMYIDLCEPDICSNNGTCISSLGNYKCLCPEGFSGDFCEVNIDDCKQGSCYNNGKCIDLINDYACQCQKGFSGRKCEVNVNDCVPNPCLNGGTCFDKINDYKCCCRSGYSGNNCEEKVDPLDPCRSISCQNNGVCVANNTDANCVCRSGFAGKSCEINIDDCNDYICFNNGSCVDGIAKASCKCPLKFTGSQCEKEAIAEYFLGFEKPVTSNYVELQNTQLLYAITVSFFMRTSYKNSESSPTVISYSYYNTKNKTFVENALTLFDLNRIILYLHGEMLHTGYVANSDSKWHHYAVTWETNEGKWEFFVDGEVFITGTHVGQKEFFWPGIFILGQEQDSLGGSFSISEAFIGDITEFNVWDYAMPKEEIKLISSHCGIVGNVIPWVEAISHVHGNVVVSEDVDHCKSIGPCLNRSCYCLYAMEPTDKSNDLCKHSVSTCEPNPCKNGQQCVLESSDAFCNCSQGYNGRFCEFDVNECLLNNGGCFDSCVNEVGSYHCACRDGMVLSSDDFTCIDPSYCEMNDEVYLNGEEWISDCQNCLCDEGNVKCHPVECNSVECHSEENLIHLPGNCCAKCISYSFCFISPNLKVSTFDYSPIEISEGCSHIMVEDCVNGLNSVRYESSMNGSLFLYDHCMKIEVSNNSTLLLDDSSVILPFNNTVFNAESQDENIVIWSKSGLYIQKHSSGEIMIAVPREVAGHLCGLCGNFQAYNVSISQEKSGENFSCFIRQEQGNSLASNSRQSSFSCGESLVQILAILIVFFHLAVPSCFFQ